MIIILCFIFIEVQACLICIVIYYFLIKKCVITGLIFTKKITIGLVQELVEKKIWYHLNG